MTRLVNSYVQDSVRIAKDMKPGDETAQVVERHFGDQFEVLDPASYPSIPVAPNRMIFLAVGMGCGLSIGLLTLRLRQRGRQMRTA